MDEKKNDFADGIAGPTMKQTASASMGHHSVPLDLSPTSTRETLASTVGDEDEVAATPSLSTTRLLAAHIGAALTLFLATTDANIVSTSLPTISREFNASQTQYTWVAVAYMLTQTAFQPLYGRISELVGRKVLLFSSVSIFGLGSLLCGVSTSTDTLIISRAIAGVGGGGIVSSVWVMTSEIVPISSRAKWSQALSITWSCSAVAGPLLGGVFSGNTDSDSQLSWRWGFYINLPVCLFASVVLLFSLRNVKFQRSADTSMRTLMQRFDFGGLLLFMTGTILIVFGFSFANQNRWNSATTITTLTLGLGILICAGVYEIRTKRDCLFPPTAFTNPTAVIILVITFLHNFAFTSGTFYLALFFQTVNAYTPLQAGLQLLPFSLGSSLASMPAAWFIEFWQRRRQDSSGQNLVISMGLFVSTIGFGLLILLGAQASRAEQIIYPLVSGVGMGLLFHAPYQVFVRCLKPEELAAGTSAFFLVRFTGATVGLAVSGAILYARASHLLPTGVNLSVAGSLEGLNSFQSPILRLKVLDAFAVSIQTIWIVCAPCLGLSLLMSLMMKKLTLSSVTTHNLASEKAEAGATAV
ncbi:amino acid permease ScVBA-like protein [Hymenopellis radicata]|nr:amino acid permease ScVBA-like protein [Hymenopellis radicata]